jgi:hypothetical protein
MCGEKARARAREAADAVPVDPNIPLLFVIDRVLSILTQSYKYIPIPPVLERF